jgi:hypothetical protein
MWERISCKGSFEIITGTTQLLNNEQNDEESSRLAGTDDDSSTTAVNKEKSIRQQCPSNI